jgi:hypothetical protein
VVHCFLLWKDGNLELQQVGVTLSAGKVSARSLRAIAAALNQPGVKTPCGIGFITVLPVSTFSPKKRFQAL